MIQDENLPSSESVRSVMNTIAPGCEAYTISKLPGSYSNYTHRVAISLPGGARRDVVLRRYATKYGSPAEKARREYRTLELLQRHDIPAPKPLILDEAGSLLGSPGIVTDFASGTLILAAPENLEWVSKTDIVAKMLAQIHLTPLPSLDQGFLMDGNQEAVWFLRSGAVPDYMRKHPDGERVWHAVHERLPKIQSVSPVLVHLDYWSGNLLWDQDQISAVVDWEEAAYGDPGIDVAYTRMELFLEGMDAAAASFLEIYEQEAGQKVANLGFWELAASARPMLALDEWLTRPLMDERFRRFISRALYRAG